MAGHTTKFEYGSMRRMTKRIDALLRQTQYEYCKCGALEKVTDALGQEEVKQFQVSSWDTDSHRFSW
ncbi:MAG: hypothetical protein ACI8QI_000984 [Limisphaerales bacterium]|jgi:hypothetical protein